MLEMLVWLLFALGVVWIVLGATKTTGLKARSGEPLSESEEKSSKGLLSKASEVMAVWFFIFGLLHLVIAVFLLNAPVAFGQQLNLTQNNTYANFTGSEETSCWNETGDFIGNGSTNMTNPLMIGQTTVYSYSIAGQEVVNMIVLFDVATLAVYFLLFALSIFKAGVDSVRRRVH